MPGNALQVTVTAPACPWGFNPQNRAPTTLEQLRHDLCELDAAAQQNGDYISATLYELIAGLWDALDALVSAAAAGVSAIGDGIKWVADGIADGWRALMDELGYLQGWAIALLFFAAAAFLAPEIGRGINEARR